MKKQLFNLLFLVSLFISVSAQTKEAVKIEEFGNDNCEQYLARIDNAIQGVSNNPASKIYVLVYEGKVERYRYKKDGSSEIEFVLPQYGLARTRINSMKKLLSYRTPAHKDFEFVKAGFRENFTVELWLVPSGVMPPKPTPTLTKMKYRKGKPQGFCMGCC